MCRHKKDQPPGWCGLCRLTAGLIHPHPNQVGVETDDGYEHEGDAWQGSLFSWNDEKDRVRFQVRPSLAHLERDWGFVKGIPRRIENLPLPFEDGEGEGYVGGAPAGSPT